MRRYVSLSSVVFCLLLLVAGTFGQSLAPSPTGTWTITGAMSQARTGAAAAAMNNGAVLVTGGTDSNGNVLAAVELFGAGGAFRTVAPMNVARTGHTATWVPNPAGSPAGFVLVTGGTTTGGTIVGSVELYDPDQNVWRLLPTPMVDARSGHPATLLPNSAVLVSGGTNGAGLVGSAEQFGLASEQFLFASLPSARKNHAAAALADGRVLLVGGTDASGTLNTTEIYDPTNNTLTPGPNLATPRANATATTLLDGTVLIAGGSYPEGAAANGNVAELQSAEIYNPAANTIAPTAMKMVQARAGHQAFLLPNSNKVLIVGGVLNGGDLASAELYTPWTGTFVATGAMTVARSNATGAALFPMADGQLLVAGGSNQKSGELYGFATIETDLPDYAPGTPVIMTGTGWKPGETVNLYMQVIPETAFVTPLQTTAADGYGNVMYGMWAPDQTDIGARFYLTAVGQTSGAQAQTTFTDASPTLSVTVVGPAGSGYVTSQDGFITSSCTAAPSPGNNGTACRHTYSANLSTTLTATANSGYTFTGWSGGCTGTSSCAASANGGNTFSATATFAVANQAPAFTSGSSTTFTVGTAGAFTVTASGTPTPTLSESGTLPAGVTFTASNGSLSGTPTQAGTFNLTFTAANGVGTNATQGFVLTVNKGTQATLSVTGMPGTAQADGATFTVGASGGSGSGAVTFAATGACSVNPTSGLVTMISGTGTCSVTATKAADSNYNVATSAAATVAAAKATLTVTASSATVTYGSAVPTITASITGYVNGDGISVVTTPPTCSTTYTTTSNAGSAQSTSCTGAAAANYTFNYVNGSVTVNKATPTITWATPAAITYGTALSGTQLNASSGGVAGTFAYSPAAGAVLNAGPQTLNVTFAPTDTTNYNGGTGSVTLTVNKATPTITWATPSAISYGTALSATQLNATSGGVAGNFNYNPAAGEVLAAGPQTLNVSFTPTDTTNYNGASGSVSLTVNKLNASVTPAPATKSFGAAEPAFTGVLSGFLSADNVVATYSRNAGENVAGGPYVISATLSPLGALSNYNITYNTAAFTITPATALVQLGNLNQNYDGTQKGVSVTTVPSPLSINVLYSNDSYGPTSVPPTNPGSYSVVVTSGNGNYVGQASDTLVINKLDPALNMALLTGMPEPSAFGTRVYFELAMAKTPCPTGTVQFYLDGEQVSTVNLTGADCSSPVEYQTTSLLPGAHNIYAIYSGDNFYNPNNSNTASHMVNGDQTQVILATSGLSSNYGKSITFTATVTNVDNANAPVAGSVQFFDGDFLKATVPVSATAPYTAIYSTSELGAGSHSIWAQFVDPSGTYLGSSSAAMTESIDKTTPTITWPNPADIVYGTKLSSTQLNATAMDGENVVNGTFVYTPDLNTVLAVGQRNLTVAFTPTDTANYNGQNALATINVTAIPVTPVITVNSKPYDGTNAATLNTVSLSGVLPADNGNVQLVAGSATFSDASVGAGKRVTVTGLALSGNAKGNYSLGSDTATTTADITTANATLMAGNAAVAYNKSTSQQVSLAATLTSGTGTVNDGTVTFKVMQGSTQVGTTVTANVANGNASANFTLPAGTAVGSYTIAASYAGSVGYADTSDNTHTLAVTSGVNVVQGTPTMVSGNWSAGGTIVVGDTLTNSGPNPTPSWFVNRYYLSSDGTTKSYSLGNRQVPALTGSGAGATSTAQTTVTIPTNAIGTFYLLACADAVTGESLLTDNCAYATPAVKLGSLNLVQNAPSLASGNWAPGGSIVVADSVTNSGPASSTSFYVRFYLSSDGTTKSYSLGNRQVSSVAGSGAASTSSAQTTVTVPTGIVGSWYLLACSDAVINETSTTDNCAHSASASALGGLNLIEGQPSVVSGNWATGGAIVVGDSVSNSGPGSSTFFYNRYYLSSDGVTHNYSLGNRQVSALAGNNVPSTAQTQVNIPVNATGTYYLVACADAVNGESATSDNCAHSATAMPLGGVNLVEAAPSVTGTPTKGAKVTFVDTVTNSGPGAPAGFYVRFYLSVDGTAKSYSLGNRQVSGLTASGVGATSTGQTPVTLPTTMSGSLYVLACADPVTGETSTTDNCKASAITIQ